MKVRDIHSLVALVGVLVLVGMGRFPAEVALAVLVPSPVGRVRR